MDTLLRAGLSNAVAATVMALLVTALSRPLARRPAILHGLWLLVLLKLVTPPFYEVPIPWPVAAPPAVCVLNEPALIEVDTLARIDGGGGAPGDPREAAVVPLMVDLPREEGRLSPGPPSTGAASIGILRWVGAIWLAGSMAVLLLSLRRILRFQRLLAEAREASWLEQEWVDDWARRLGLRRAPGLLWVPGRVSPMVWFVGLRPRLIIPQGLWKRLDGQQRSTLLAHELAHLRRGDHHVRLLELLATSLFWWHPLVWWMRGPLRDVEEQCCDAWVVWALPDAVRSYAETLLDTLEFLEKSGRPDPLLASGLGKVPHLRRRLTMIMTGSSRRLPGLAGKLGLLAVAGAMLPIGATWAQKADDPKEVRVVVKSDGEPSDAGGDALYQGKLNIVTSDVFGDQQSPDSAVVVMRVEGGDKPTSVIESGSIDDVVKKLQSQIDKLKKGGDSSDAAKDRIKALTQALAEIKKAQGGAHRVMIRSDVLDRAKVHTTQPTPKDAAAIEKLGAEVSRLRKNLESNLKELEAIQAKIRALGGDPGEVPVVRWRLVRPVEGTHTQTYTIAKPIEVEPKELRVYTNHKPIEAKPQVFEYRTIQTQKPLKLDVSVRPSEPAKIEVDDPAEQKVRMLLKGMEQNVRAGGAPDSTRIEALEKKLKALQEEVERLKKG
jgi:beta-lactamase regulating signal transducer with metallopeptidase domain